MKRAEWFNKQWFPQEWFPGAWFPAPPDTDTGRGLNIRTTFTMRSRHAAFAMHQPAFACVLRVGAQTIAETSPQFALMMFKIVGEVRPARGAARDASSPPAVYADFEHRSHGVSFAMKQSAAPIGFEQRTTAIGARRRATAILADLPAEV